MTKNDLSQLYYLKKEISKLEQRIQETEETATGTSGGQITGMPHSGQVSDKIGNYAAELADLKSLLKLNIEKCYFELNRLTRFINSVEDSEMRQILNLRYINDMTWQRIAFDLGYHDEQRPRKKHDAYLKKRRESNDIKMDHDKHRGYKNCGTTGTEAALS